MMAGDEFYGDEITSGEYEEPECELCGREGHTWKACPSRDDLIDEDQA